MWGRGRSPLITFWNVEILQKRADSPTFCEVGAMFGARKGATIGYTGWSFCRRPMEFARRLSARCSEGLPFAHLLLHGDEMGGFVHPCSCCRRSDSYQLHFMVSRKRSNSVIFGALRELTFSPSTTTAANTSPPRANVGTASFLITAPPSPLLPW